MITTHQQHGEVFYGELKLTLTVAARIIWGIRIVVVLIWAAAAAAFLTVAVTKTNELFTPRLDYLAANDIATRNLVIRIAS